VLAQDVFANFVQVFGYVRDEVLRCGMFALDLFENFDWRFVWIDLFCRFRERCLLGF
jgi:hypothetical protein